MRANDADKHIDWYVFFIETVIGPELILPTALFENYSKNRF